MDHPRAPRPKPTLRTRRWRRLAIAGCAAMAAIVAAELVLLLANAFPPIVFASPGEHLDRENRHFEVDATVGWRLKPNIEFSLHQGDQAIAIRADANGHRVGTVERVGLRPHTIVLAGDSFAWGVDVKHEHSLAALLEQQYPAVRVENIAQPGFGIDQIVLSVVHQGLREQPDLVIVMIYGMDAMRSHTAYREDLGFNKPSFALRDGRLQRLTKSDRNSAFAEWLEHNSRLLGLWRRAQRRIGYEYGKGSWWSLNEALLDELHSKVAAAGVPLLIVNVPLHDWRPFTGLIAWCKTNEVALIDPVALEPTKPEAMYFAPAGHFTPWGHRYVFDLVRAWMGQQELPFIR